MMRKSLVAAISVVTVLTSSGYAYGVTMTFDDVPAGSGLRDYYTDYGMNWLFGFYVADHTNSTWGLPRSGSNVLAWNQPDPGTNLGLLEFKKVLPFPAPPQVLLASSIGGYFSTEPGAVFQMIGYHGSMGNPVAAVTIGSSQGSWNNVYVEIDYDMGMEAVLFTPVTTDALAHFCADDITVSFIPEPSSLLALLAGLGGFGLLLRGRGR